jgi:hypothetical protein
MYIILEKNFILAEIFKLGSEIFESLVFAKKQIN